MLYEDLNKITELFFFAWTSVEDLFMLQLYRTKINNRYMITVTDVCNH